MQHDGSAREPPSALTAPRAWPSLCDDRSRTSGGRAIATCRRIMPPLLSIAFALSLACNPFSDATPRRCKMSFGEFARLCDDIENRAKERALAEGKSPEEAQKLAEQERMDQGSAVITALGRSCSWGVTGAAVGSVVPVVGTVVGGTIGFVAGAISAIVDPKPSIRKSVSAYGSLLGKISK
jgi:hypothetical protein